VHIARQIAGIITLDRSRSLTQISIVQISVRPTIETAKTLDDRSPTVMNQRRLRASHGERIAVIARQFGPTGRA